MTEHAIASGVVGASPIDTNPNFGILPNSPGLDGRLLETYISLEFRSSSDFSSLTNIVVPSVGTATITATENGVVYGSIVNGTAIDVTTADYPRLSKTGNIGNVRGVTAGIVGATHWRILVSRR